MQHKRLFFFVLLLFAAYNSQAQQAAQQLAQRLLGEVSQHFEFVVSNPSDLSDDYFALSQNNGRIVITGNNDISLCVGLNHYLRKYGLLWKQSHTTLSCHSGSSSITAPTVIPWYGGSGRIGNASLTGWP